MASGDRPAKDNKAVPALVAVMLMIVILIAIPWLIDISEAASAPAARETNLSSDESEVILPDGDYGYGDTDKVAFVASITNEGPLMYGEDYWETITYSVYYDGTLEVTWKYALSGERTYVCNISEEDFNTIMYLAGKVMDEKPYEDMDYSNTMDGSTYGFCIYDTEGNATRIYGGYIYGIDDLENIVDVLDRYDSLTDAS